MQLLSGQENTLIAIVAHSGERLIYQFALGKNAKGNCRTYCQLANELFGGKGGGNETFAQGGCNFFASWREKSNELKEKLA
jgi:alanyl-tRNA synthetase